MGVGYMLKQQIYLPRVIQKLLDQVRDVHPDQRRHRLATADLPWVIKLLYQVGDVHPDHVVDLRVGGRRGSRVTARPVHIHHQADNNVAIWTQEAAELRVRALRLMDKQSEG